MCGSRGGSLEGRSLWRGRETKSALCACRGRRAGARAGCARRHALRQRYRRPPPAVDLPTAGAIDWAVWGYAGGGTSTTLTPDVRKLGGKAIGALTNIDPAPSAPLRGIGQFAGPYSFSWTNGAPTGSASGVRAGLQHNGGPPPSPLGADVSTLGKGFSFDVPAGTAFRTLKVYVATNRADGQLTASLSDGSAPDYVNTLPAAVDIRSGIYTITYAAGSSGQKLHVSWIETADNCTAFRCDNAAIYAVALSAPIVVNTSADHDDGVCNAVDCTLREAINAANNLGGGGRSCLRSHRTAR